MIWVLRNGTKRQWYRDMGQIGPRLTTKIDEAARFKTKREAMRSDAYFFALLALGPERLK